MGEKKISRYNIGRIRGQLKPGQILIVGFLSIILLGALLLDTSWASQSGERVGFINAFFTATSAVCVTGLSVVDTGTFWSPFGKVVILCLIQVGGLGFMTMATSVAIIMGKKISLRNRLIMQEALNQFTISGVVGLTRYIMLTTFAIEGIGALLLSFKFIPEYGFVKGLAFSIFHSISAFCNAGFDLIGHGQSLTPYAQDTYFSFVIMALIIVGGIGFSVIIDVWKNGFKYKKFSLHSKLVVLVTAVLIFGGFAIFFVFEFRNPQTIGDFSLMGKMTASMFQSVTTRTAGFNTIDISSMTMQSRFMTMFLMMIGGSSGSTAGGLKTTTVAVIFLMVVALMRNRDDTEFCHRRIPKQVIRRSMTIIFIAIMLVITVITCLCITESQFTLEQIMFESISAFGTVGLSMGITPQMSVLGKLIISFTMFAGRLGPLTIVLGLSIRSPKKTLIRYPQEKIMVG